LSSRLRDFSISPRFSSAQPDNTPSGSSIEHWDVVQPTPAKMAHTNGHVLSNKKGSKNLLP
jgi:hypothetical protein